MRTSDPSLPPPVAQPVPPVSDPRPSLPLDPERTFREALPFILDLARRRGLDRQGQLDVAQETGARIVAHIAEYDPERGTPTQWALGIARNEIRTRKRADRTEQRFIVQGPVWDLGEKPSPDLTPEEKLRAAEVLGAINEALTEEQRAISELALEGYTGVEIAQIMGLTPGRVAQRIREARARLDSLLRRLGEDEKSMTRVRGVIVPLGAASEHDAEGRGNDVQDELADELWKGALERGRCGGGGASARPGVASAAAPAVESAPRFDGIALCAAALVIVPAVLIGWALRDGPRSEPGAASRADVSHLDVADGVIARAGAQAGEEAGTATTSALAGTSSTVALAVSSPSAEVSAIAMKGAPSSGSIASSNAVIAAPSPGPIASMSSSAVISAPSPAREAVTGPSEDTLLRMARGAIATDPGRAVVLLREHERRFGRRNADVRGWLMAQAQGGAQRAVSPAAHTR